MSLPSLLPRKAIRGRLLLIFPEGSSNRGYCTRELAASTVFTALYVGATDARGGWFGPKHVYRMTREQASKTDEHSRLEYAANVMKPGFEAPGQRWYRDNTREPIRDETLRDGLISVGAVVERTDVATTSSKPRYTLSSEFAALFDSKLAGEELEAAISAWQVKALSPGALARIALVRGGAATDGHQMMVTFPNGETRRLKPGPSSEITKAVIEVFARRFLLQPAVLFVSESGNRIVARDDELARSIGLTIKAEKNLPDTILVDLGPEHPRIVFVEVVATDGPINERRKRALEAIAEEAGFPLEHTAFVTAYLDRSATPFRKSVDVLAWGSYAWFVSEPDGLLELSVVRRELD